MSRLTEAQWKRLGGSPSEQGACVRYQLPALGAPTAPMPRETSSENVDLADEEAGGQTDDVMLACYRGGLEQLNATHERVQQHSYGIRVDCGEVIPFLCLQVQPIVMRCLSCQTVCERHWT